MLLSTSEENYIKSIYHLQQTGNLVSTNDVAFRINTKPASVTDMLKKLKNKGLLDYEPYKGFVLSKEGNKIALLIIRKHRLWEYFLVHHLQLGWDEVHDIAEELEHINSPLLIEKLDTFLNFPRFDPHGDPIPDKKGNMTATAQINLTELAVNKKAEVKAVGKQTKELLELLRHKNIEIGTILQVQKIFDFDQSLEIKLDKIKPFTISRQLAEALFVKPL